jgi:signal peptidase I
MTERAPIPTPAPGSIPEERRAQALDTVNRTGAVERVLVEWMKTFLIAVVLFFFVRAFFVEAFKIPSGSMERTLLVGDFLLVNKLIYGPEIPFLHYRLPAIRPPKRGDVLVFQYPLDRTKNYVKRVVGLPGDTVAMEDGQLVLNGDSVSEVYVHHTDPEYDPSQEEFRWQRDFLVRSAEAGTDHPSRNNWGPLVVPPKSYFVLGDNRDNSADSRYWGFVPDSLVRGQPLFVYFSYAPDTAHRFPWLTNIRWDRLGEGVD